MVERIPTETEKETARRMRSVLAKDLQQLERSIKHYDLASLCLFDELAEDIWVSIICVVIKQPPWPPAVDATDWHNKPEVW